MKICKFCKKEYEDGYRGFCSKECAHKFYSTGSSSSFYKERKEHINECKELLKKLEERLLVSHKGQRNNSHLKRIFCYSCHKLLNFSSTETAIAMGWDHTTVTYHIKKIKPEEIEAAEKFIHSLNTKKTIIERIPNIYERTGFRYDNGKKEVSNVWKRVYGIQQRRGCLRWGL